LPFTLNESQNITCTITNDDQPGSITIKKDVGSYNGIYDDIYSSSIFSVYLNGDILTTKQISDKEIDPNIAIYIDMNAGYYLLEEVVADGFSFEGCYIQGQEEELPELYSLSITELRYDPYNPYFKLNNGEDLEIVCRNIEIEPQLEITKQNDSPIEGLLTGSTVLYTLRIEAPSDEIEGTYLVNNVKVTDILPEGFGYVLGSWTATSSIRENIKDSPTIEPTYSGFPAIWKLGNMVEGEIVTLTYIAKINLLNEPGIYKDLAYVQGDSILAVKDSGDVLGLNTGDENSIGENFVGTKVLVIEPIEDGGEVLGASITLPATGAETYITLGALISMILGFILILFKPKRKLNTILLTTVLLFGIFTLLKPISTFAQESTQVSIRLEEPKTGVTDREFEITYVALSIPVQTLKIQCQYSLDNFYFTNFDTPKTTNSGSCLVNESIITGSGTYYFRATATADGTEPKTSEIVSVNITNNPLPVMEYSKTKGTCTYTLKFKPTTSKVQIFRSDNQKSFNADDSTLITKPFLSVTPNILETYTDTSITDCSKEYYYAIRSIDDYNNVSTLVTDDIITIITTPSTTSTVATTVTVNGETGEIAGEETTAGEETEGEGVPNEEDNNGEVKGDEEENIEDEDSDKEESFWNKYKYLIIAMVVVALGSAGYNYVIRRKK